MNRDHIWKFFRIGGFDQVLLETPDDLINLEHLDQKLWAALSCPTQGSFLDKRTFQHIDTNGDSRIRVPELLAAVRWAISCLKSPASLVTRDAELPLADIASDTEEGRTLLEAARTILKSLGKSGIEVITPDDTQDVNRIFAETDFNGDGIITPRAAEDDAVRDVITDIITTMGAEIDRSGRLGINEEKVAAFFSEAQGYSDWWTDIESRAEDILFLGEETARKIDNYSQIKAKVDDFFTRCSLAAFDNRAGEPLNPAATEYQELGSQLLSMDGEGIRRLPLARVEPGRNLPLGEGLNPAWAPQIDIFRVEMVVPLLGEKKELALREWHILKDKCHAFEAWLAGRKGSIVEQLGLERVREILDSDSLEQIQALIARDKAMEPTAKAIQLVDRLVLYHRDLYTLLYNYVSFKDFYSLERKAIFQAGTLYIDQRSFDLCLRVEDVAKHSSMAHLSGVYLLYAACSRQDSNETFTICAAVTDGESDNLMVGRNGVFYDRHGLDWDSTIIKIVEQPISIRQAFWLPYRKMARLIAEQAEKFAAARDKASQEKTAGSIVNASQAVEAGKSTPPQPFDVAKFAGIFAAIGLAIGAIGTALAAIITGFLNLSPWQMPLVVVGLVLIISGPSMAQAWLKLRKRNLAPLLDANGWAINTRARMNIPFGAALTHMSMLPPGAKRSLHDPFAEKKRPWKLMIILLLIVSLTGYLLYSGYAAQWFGQLTGKPPLESNSTSSPEPIQTTTGDR